MFIDNSSIFDEKGQLNESAIRLLDDTTLPICFKREDLKPGMTKEELYEKADKFLKEYNPYIENFNKQHNSIEENKSLIQADSMSEEEVDKELKSYSIDTSDLSLDVKRFCLMQARCKRNLEDEGSDELDYKTGTYVQRAQGTCTILSAIRNMSEEDVKKFLTIEKDADNKITGCSVVFPGDTEKKPVFLSIDEIKTGQFKENGMTLEGFCDGDLTARAIEMAYMKRFSQNSVEFEETDDSYIIKLPNDTESIKISKNEVKEKKVEINGNIYTIDTEDCFPETIAYQIAYAKRHNIAPTKDGKASPYWVAKTKDNQGITYGLDLQDATNLFIEKSKKTSSLKNLTENDFKNSAVAGSIMGIDDTKKKDILRCENGSIIYPNHGYSFVKYDEKTKTVYVSNPHSTTTLIPIPLADAQKYMCMSGIRTWG